MRYVHNEGIHLPDLLKMCQSLGKQLLHERFGELNIEEWSKCGVKKKRQNLLI